MSMSKSKIKVLKGGYTYAITLSGMTEGNVMALTRALAFYNSPVGNDVLAYLRTAAYEVPGLLEKIDSYVADVEKIESEKQKKFLTSPL